MAMRVDNSENGGARRGAWPATALHFRIAPVLLSLVRGILCGPWPARAQGGEVAEYRLKLAFLYNFVQYIQWPADAFGSPTAPVVLCVAGPNPFKGEIRQGLSGRTAGGHPIQIRRIRADDSLLDCHVIFVRASERRTAAKLLASLKGANILTVGEDKSFADEGGLINMSLDENRLRFEVNLDAAMQTRLKISSKILGLARIVKIGNKP